MTRSLPGQLESVSTFDMIPTAFSFSFVDLAAILDRHPFRYPSCQYFDFKDPFDSQLTRPEELYI